MFVIVACVFLNRALLFGEVFLPAQLLRTLAPWNASTSAAQRIPWNPLAYDAIGQFYPWRAFASYALRTGILPLWNPYSFCGAPFIANSQSAVFYPPNLLYLVMPADRAFAVAALVHLCIAAAGMWLLLRFLGASPLGGVVAGLAFAFCSWQVSWLQLPTFLDTACWLPFALLGTLRLVQTPSPRRAVALAAVIGLVLLAGHLQIAFYVLLATILAAAYLLALRIRQRVTAGGATGKAIVRSAAWWLLALAIGTLGAAAQLLPAVELANRSHRAAPPTPSGYAAYTAYAVPPQALATLFLPDVFGNPSRPDLPYRGTSQGGLPFNYAEGALYASLGGLLLASIGAVSRRHRMAAVYFGCLAILALLLALGTRVDAVLYFHVPGFGRSGSPGRALVLWAFGVAGLAGLGMDELVRGNVRLKQVLGAFAVITALWAAAIAYASGSPGFYAPSDANLWRQVGLFAAAFTALAASAAFRMRWAHWALVGVLIVDLVWQGIGYNATASPADVYPAAEAIRMAAQFAGHDRIAPINSDWSFNGPRAVLPPNASVVYRIRDVQGYDSLFPGRYKDFMNHAARPAMDASPIEVGNMVFAKNPYNPLLAAAGVRVIISTEPLSLPGASENYADGVYVYALAHAKGRTWMEGTTAGSASVRLLEDGIDKVRVEVHAAAPNTLHLADEMYPGWHARVNGRPAAIALDEGVFRRVDVPAGTSLVEFVYEPESFRIGLYLTMIAACGATAMAATRRRFYP